MTFKEFMLEAYAKFSGTKKEDEVKAENTEVAEAKAVIEEVKVEAAAQTDAPPTDAPATDAPNNAVNDRLTALEDAVKMIVEQLNKMQGADQSQAMSAKISELETAFSKFSAKPEGEVIGTAKKKTAEVKTVDHLGLNKLLN